MAETLSSPNLEEAREAIRKTLDEPAPFQPLWDLVKKLRDQGMSQSVMNDLFTEFHRKHRDDTDETRHDAVVDVMDFIVGWCHSRNRLYPDAE